MSIHIIVDGYNMIRQSMWLNELDKQDMQLGRDTLIDVLAVYKKLKGHSITIVFDGADMPSIYRQRDKKKGIKINFSRSSETADQVINRIVIKERQRALVVSCDREVRLFAESCGASVVDCHVFERKVLIANQLCEEFLETEYDCDQVKLSTHKKGPSRRLSKKKRKNKSRVSKL